MLELENLSVMVGEVEVLSDVSFTVPTGELHILLGPNGSGKSSLLATVMGLPPFEVTGGDIRFDGQSILPLSTAERAQLGIGLAYQRPPSLEGVTVRRLADALGATGALDAGAERLDLIDFLDRDMQAGFSGGEVKRAEVLKLILQDPALLLFDEPESGVDLEHVKAVGQAIDALAKSPTKAGKPRSALVITHTGLILNHVSAERAHVMRDGRLAYSGPARALFDHVQTHGYSTAMEEA